ncbi:MAG: hypothetical protein AB7U79_01575 [Candidatus Izemoplasmatales bacterium]
MPTYFTAEQLDLLFNSLFISIIVIAVLVGLFRGFKKTLISFITTLAFYLLFFLTLNTVVNFIWTFDTPYVGQLLVNVSPNLSSVTSLQDALPQALAIFVPEDYAFALGNENLMLMATGIALFAVKLVYTLLYFTVFYVLYKLLVLIIRVIFFPDRKNNSKYVSKNRGLGALFGVLNGAMGIMVVLILYGGLISIIESMTLLVPTENTQTQSFEFPRQEVYQASRTIIPLEDSSSPFDQIAETVDMLNNFVTSYNENVIVQYGTSITVYDDQTESQVSLNLYLFDEVLSFEYKDTQIALRKELQTVSSIAGVAVNSNYMETRKINDITGAEVSEVFNLVSHSKLITSMIPIAIEVGSTAYETDLTLPVDELYAIDWATEIAQLGEVAGTIFEIISVTGVFEEDFDVTTIDVTGDEVRGLFDALGESELVTLSAYVAVESLLPTVLSEDLNAVITIPEGLVWADEFSAFGAIAGAVLDTGVTIESIVNSDPLDMITLLSSLDFTVLLDSKIVTQALINVLEGKLNIEELNAFLVIPDNIIWLDQYDDDGNLIASGELRNILSAINAISPIISTVDFQNFQTSDLASLDFDSINSIFESEVLVASISEYVKTMQIGFDLILPDSIFDENGYILKTELQNLVSAVGVVANKLMCEEGDTACEEIGINLSAAFSLSDEDIDTLLSSDILEATVGDMIISEAGDALVIPPSALKEIFVNEVSQNVVSREEVKKVFKAVSILGITDINNIEMDVSILSNLATEDDSTVLDTEKADTLFASNILLATLSDYLLQMTEGDSLIVVPYYSEELVSVRYNENGIDYVSRDELTHILSAILVLDIQDFNNLESLDLSVISENKETLLSSAILHATISKQLLDMDIDMITIPTYDEDENPIKIVVGSDTEATTLIKKTELFAIFDALQVLNITDISTFDGNIDLSLLSEGNNLDVLLSSSILQATISTQVLNLDADGTVTVPYVSEEGNDIRVTVGPALNQTEYIVKDEISAVFDALDVLGIQDVTTFDGSVDLTVLSEEGNLDILLSSAIIHATVSQQVFDLENDGTLTIPYYAENGTTEIRVFAGPVGFETEYLVKDEISAIFDALDVLGIEDVTTFDGSVDLSLLSEGDNASILLSSSVIQATVSKQLTDLEVDGTLVVPYKADDGVLDIRKTVGVSPNDTEYIIKSELEAIIDGLNVLGITDVETFDGSIDLSILSVEGNMDILLASSVIQATVSKQITDLETDGTLTVPYVADDGITAIRVSVGLGEQQTEYITKAELTAMIDGLNILGITDVETFDGSVDLSILAEGDNATTLLLSSTIQATVSKQIFDLGTDGTLEVPTYQEDGVTSISVTTGPVLHETTYLIKTELESIFDALDILGLTDLETFNGTVDLSTLAEGNNADIVLASSVIQATVSKQVLDLDADGTISVPYMADDDTLAIRITVGELETLTDYVLRDELVHVIHALDLLGITDVETFDGSVDISVFYDVTNRDTLLLSSIMQATISKQLIDLGSDTLLVPYEDSLSVAIRLLTGPVDHTTEYVSKTEISAIFETLEMLGITDITTFDGDIDISLFYLQENRDVLLASASMHATITKQLIDLGSDTLLVPYTDSTDTLAIRSTIGPVGLETEFILKSEIDAMFESLEVLGITDINTFDGNIDLSLFYTQDNRDILLGSASMHATISKQLFDLGSATLTVPYRDSLDTLDIRLTTGEVGFETEFVLKTEIDAMFESLEVLGITDINTFDGNIDLSLFYTQDNRDILLSSASMHATISKQLFDLGSATLTIPYRDSEDSLAIRLTTGAVGFETEFVLKAEIDAMFEALEVLGITDINTFDGSIDLSLFYAEGNRDILLASASMHATISKQLFDLGSATLTVPYFADDDTTVIRLTTGGVGETTEFVSKPEIHAMFEALEILGITDINSFDGSIDLTLFYEQANRTVLLSSSSMHATITKQLLDLGEATLKVPTLDQDSNVIRLTVGALSTETEYIVKDEIDAMFEALELLGIDDINSFNGSIDLSLIYGEANQTILLSSASMHATITKQITDLGPTVLLVPNTDVAGTSIQATVGGTLFIYKTEIKALINGLEILGITDITAFNGTVSLVNLFNDTNQNILLSSASMHATITKQINDLGPSVLLIPDTDVDNNPIQATVSATFFIYKDEIKAIINSLEILGITDITAFNGTVSLVNLFNETNQNILLTSASMHATITKQITDLGPSVLLVPTTDIDGITIKATVSSTLFIYKDEIKAIINALEVLGVNDITAFTGSITISSLALEADQDTLLTSASMHATISQTLLDLDDAVLIVPLYTPVGEVEAERIQKTVSTTDFIIKSEIKALINSFLAMGYTDLDNFGSSIDSSKFFDDPDTLLLSYSIQATLSDKLLNGTGGNLIIPNANILGTVTIRIVESDVTYIEINEMKAILDSLDALGLTDFSNITITANLVFAADYDLLLASYSMQATISDKILTGALDESAAAGSGSLIVPTYFRETLSVGIGSTVQIEKLELKALLTSLSTLGVSDFSGAMDASVVTSLTDAQLDTVLGSGSMHVTIDNMLKGNSNINTKIPDLAYEDVYDLTDIITKVEIKAFIKATNVLATGDISNVSIDVNAVASLTPAERDIVLDSMIVRNIMTDQLEAMMLADDPFDLYWPADTSYMNNDNTTFLTEAGINEVLTHYGLI